mgnify:CR=1 FL=1
MCSPISLILVALKAWVPVHKAERILEIDRKELHRMRDDGTFKLGHHYGAGPLTRSRDTYYWHIDRVQNCLKRLTDTELPSAA